MTWCVQDVDKATSSRIMLEKKLEQLEAEIEFLQRVHQQVNAIFARQSHVQFPQILSISQHFHFVFQEIEELMKQIYSAHVSAQSALTVPDLATALKQIQTQYDDMAAKNLQVRSSQSSKTWQRGVKCKHNSPIYMSYLSKDMDSWYKTKFEDLTNKTSRHVGKVRSIREEITGAKKDVSIKWEIPVLRGIHDQ